MCTHDSSPRRRRYSLAPAPASMTGLLDAYAAGNAADAVLEIQALYLAGTGGAVLEVPPSGDVRTVRLLGALADAARHCGVTKEIAYLLSAISNPILWAAQAEVRRG